MNERTWQERHEWWLYGVPNGPYIIEERENKFYAWLLGHKHLGVYFTLDEAKEACIKDIKL